MINVTEVENNIKGYLFCKQSKYLSEFKLKVAISPEVDAKEDIIVCSSFNSEVTLILDGLSCDKSYNMSIYWSSPYKSSSNVYCIIKHMELIRYCNSIGEDNDTVLPTEKIMCTLLYIKIVLPLAIIITTATAVSCIIVILYCRWTR